MSSGETPKRFMRIAAHDHLGCNLMGMNKLDSKTRKLILRCLVEGMSIRATARTAEVSKLTVSRLMVAAGKVCADFQANALVNLPCQRIQVDETWSFAYCKDKNVKRAKAAPMDAGDVWTWTAICAETKIVPSWQLGDRTSATAIEFMDDLRSRLAHRVQLASDGHKAYLEALEGAFGGDIDYAMLVKVYDVLDKAKTADKRCSPPNAPASRKRLSRETPTTTTFRPVMLKGKT